MNAKRIFWILFLLNLFNYIDRQMLYALFPLLQEDLALSDVQLGALASIFMLVYMCYAPVVGYFAAHTPRRYWIGASAFLWSAATMACGAVKNYSGLLLARGLCGAGESGFTTLAQPLLAEHYPKEKRATILSLFSLALPIGAALGYLLGGVLGTQVGWRVAFYWVGAPGVILGALALLWLREDAAVSTPVKPNWKNYKALLQNKPFLWICLAHAMITFIMGGLSAWMPTYFTRYLGLSVQQAGSVFGICVIVSGAIGTYVGGKWADYLLKRSENAYYSIMKIGLWGAFLGVVLELAIPCIWLSIGCISLAIACLFLPLGPIAAALVNVTEQPVRPMAFAVNIFIIHILGDALSPTLIGGWSGVWGLKTAVFLASLAVFPGLGFVHLAQSKRSL